MLKNCISFEPSQYKSSYLLPERISKKLHLHKALAILNLMKKRAAKLLLSVFLLTQLSSLCWYLYKPVSHMWFETMHEMKHAWPGNQTKLISLTINLAALKELQNDEDEITIDGMLYDIDHSVIRGNKITLYLESDAEETRSNDQYAQLTKQLHKCPGATTATSSHYRIAFFALFFSKQNTTTLGQVATKKKYNTQPLQTYNDHFLCIINPPPEG